MERFGEYKDFLSPGQLGYLGRVLAAEGGLCVSPVARERDQAIVLALRLFDSERNIIETRRIVAAEHAVGRWLDRRRIEA